MIIAKGFPTFQQTDLEAAKGGKLVTEMDVDENAKVTKIVKTIVKGK